MRDDWFGKEGVLPAEIVFLSQDDADVAGEEPDGDWQNVEHTKSKINRSMDYMTFV